MSTVPRPNSLSSMLHPKEGLGRSRYNPRLPTTRTYSRRHSPGSVHHQAITGVDLRRGLQYFQQGHQEPVGLKVPNSATSTSFSRSLLSVISLVPQSAFSIRLAEHGFNFYQMFQPDFMHEFELGVWKSTLTHLVRMVHSLGGNGIRLLNTRYVVCSGQRPYLMTQSNPQVPRNVNVWTRGHPKVQ